jgi:hypothetical protein
MRATRRVSIVVGLAGCIAIGLLAATASGGTKKAADKPLSSLSFDYASADDAVGLFKTVGDAIVADGTKLGFKV